jgi:hypothetical protein
VNYSLLIKNKDRELEARTNMQKAMADKMAEVHEKNQVKFQMAQ